MYKLNKFQSYNDYSSNILGIRTPNVSKVLLDQGHIVKI